MDPFYLTVGVFGVLGAVTSCLKLFKKHVGPSSMSAPEAESLKKSLYDFHGVMKSFQTYLDLEADEDDRMIALDHLKPAVNRAQESLQIIKAFLESGRTERLFRGVKFDKKLKLSQRYLDEAKQLFNMAITADEHKIMREVNSYVQAVKEDLQDVQANQLSSQQDTTHDYIRTWFGAQADNDMNNQLHERNLTNRHIDTCKWLLDHDVFQDWLNTEKNGMPSKLWLRGSPGTGKSFICSTAIEHVSNTQQEMCLYYFYRFDDQSATRSKGEDPAGRDVRVAALLVDQLFRHFWRQDRRIATPVGAYMKTANKTLGSLAEVIRVIMRHGHQYSQENGTTSNTKPASLFLCLDGLDENKDPQAVSEILKLFEGLEEDFTVLRKTWVSSQETYSLQGHLKDWPSIHADEHVEDDVKSYLATTIPRLNDTMEMNPEVENKPLDDWIQEKLQTRARGNFLYAKLMSDWLQDDVLSVDDIRDLITSRVPNKIEEMYRRIFLQYQEEQQHKYMSLIFSLVAFARRPLRLSELNEAIMLALSDSAIGLDPSKAPTRLQRLFTPLIEVQNDPNELDNPFCRLTHSTVQEFLIQNPDILQGAVSLQGVFAHTISPSRIGDLCLRYLSMTRYSRLTEVHPGSCHVPLALSHNDSQQHGLLPYCAKFWVRHLDDLPPTSELRKALRDFLRSPNFQTLIQAQSLFVAAQFSQFSFVYNRPMHGRVFPRWFGGDLDSSDPESCEEAQRCRFDYRHFVIEWGYLLERSACLSYEQGECPLEHFWGEVDRCLVGLLGPKHMMNNMKERYPSFTLSTEQFEYHKGTQLVIAEAISPSTFQYTVISSPSQDSEEISLHIWDLNRPETPRRIPTRALPTDINGKATASPPVAFSNEAAAFLMGNMALEMRDCDSPISLDEPRAGRAYQSLSTDFDRRGDIIVIASRNVHQQALEKKSPGDDVKVGSESRDDSESDSSDNESEDGSDDSYSTISRDENSAHETCSEGSTDFESSGSEDENSDDDPADDYGLDDFSEDQDETESDYESEDGKQEVTKTEPGRAILRVNYGPSIEKKLEFEGDVLKQKEKKRPTYPGVPTRFKDARDRIIAKLTVYNISSGKAVRLFHYDHDVPAMLYHSPPVLHPHKTLLVWPLGGGEVLFADYEQKTYFARATMPTTRDTRHICMKTHFSPCGEYLHIASVEARLGRTRSAAAKDSCGDCEDKQRIVLSLFLTTHRLSSRKTSTSPPRLIHRVKLTLGHFTGMSLAKLPFTFTWTPDHLHFTISGTRLNVFRIGLFRPSMSSAAVVTVPRLSVMLPLSASARQVHYLPPAREGGGSVTARGVVLLGSYGARGERVQLRHNSIQALRRGMGDVPDKELQDYPSPAVGLSVDEEQDLGGWIPFSVDRQGEEAGVGVTKFGDGGERFRDGRLTRKMEAFNWRDDVDLEGICDKCNSPLLFRSGPG